MNISLVKPVMGNSSDWRYGCSSIVEPAGLPRRFAFNRVRFISFA